MAVKLAELTSVIRTLADRGGGFGSELEAGLRELAQALDQRADWSTADLAKKLKPKSETNAQTTRSRNNREFSGAPTDPVVKAYLDRLAGAGSYKEGLEVVAKMKAEGTKLRAPVLAEIAGRYQGVRLVFAKKSQAFDAIEDSLARQAWDARSREIIRDRVRGVK
jgi:hypothetical protein